MASPPSLRDACLKASSYAMPARRLSAMCASRWPFSSSARSASDRRRETRPHMRANHRRSDAMALLRLRRFVGREEARQDRLRLFPVACRARDLLLACPRELVELRAAIVVGHAPCRLAVALLLEFQERRVERAVVDQQQMPARLLD